MKLKKYIMTLMCALSVLLSSFAFGFESEASTLLERRNVQFSTVTPLYHSDFTIEDSTYRFDFDHTEYFQTGKFSADKYYRIAAYIPLRVQFSNEYIRQTYNSQYLNYGGERYYFDSPYVSFVVRGIEDAIVSFGFESDLIINGAYAENGTFIAQSGYANYFCNDSSSYISVYELTSEEAIPYNGLNVVLESMEDIKGVLDVLHYDNNEINYQLSVMRDDLQQIYDYMAQSKNEDKQNTDSLKENSDSQSDKLNDLNEQNKMDKIDVDSASSSVDANIDGNAISNYGVVLSSITGQGKVVQLMLIVLSVGLVSYVLFGKR